MIALIATLWLAYFFAPMGSVLMWSIILAVIFTKTNEKLAKKYKGRNRAALATVGIIVLTAIVPFIVIALVTILQLIELLNNSDELIGNMVVALNNLVTALPASFRFQIEELTQGLDLSVEQISRLVMPALSYTVSLGGNIALFFASLLAILYVTFFFLRDKDPILKFVAAAVPLNEEQKEFMSVRMANTMSATVRGVIMVAVAQSLVAGVVYALLGIKYFAVLTMMTFIGCLIPAIGSALVWLPVAIGFFLFGEPVKGVIMLLSGMFVISMIDNLLRPKLIGEKAALPEFMIFLSSIGGMAAIGFNGLFLGPIVAGFFIESWNVYTGNEKTMTPADTEDGDSEES